MEKQEINSTWKDVASKFRERYAILSDDNMLHSEGKEKQQQGRLQKKIGHTMEFLRDFIHKI